jgi:uncharacterized protein
MEFATARPGSAGEHEIQQQYGTEDRAERFYQNQMLDHLNDRMQVFVARQEMIFIATADAHGECDASFRSGPPGFVRVLDERAIAWPEYRGNGVMASMGNIAENGHVGVLMMDFFKDMVGLHVNGRASVVEDEDMQARYPWLMEETPDGRRPERWVTCAVEEAYIHCSKHIPRLARARTSRGANENRPEDRKGADYFAARCSPSPWRDGAVTGGAGDADERPVGASGPAAEPTPLGDALDPDTVPAEDTTPGHDGEPEDTRTAFARVRQEIGGL